MTADSFSSVVGPLRGIRVLDLSRHFPGGRCTLLLNDLGADVIKIESPGGDSLRSPVRSSWVNKAINRGKRSIVLNLKNPGAAAVLRRMVETADVLIESARPGSMERMGVGYEQLSVINPKLVWCSISSFGDGSPLADEAAHELNFLGYTGLLATILREPRRTGAPFALTTSMGGVMAALGILAALRERDLTGLGSRIDTSIVDSAMWLLSDIVVGNQEGINSLPHHMAAISTYICADGKMVTVSASEPSTWMVLVEGLGLPHLRDRNPMTADPQENAEFIEQFIEIFATKTSTEWLEIFQGGRASVGPVNEISDLYDDPHVIARDIIVERGGKKVLANPIRISGPDGPLTRTPPGGAPDFGHDTDEVLLATGYNAEEIAALRAAGAL